MTTECDHRLSGELVADVALESCTFIVHVLDGLDGRLSDSQGLFLQWLLHASKKDADRLARDYARTHTKTETLLIPLSIPRSLPKASLSLDTRSLAAAVHKLYCRV